MDPQLELVDRQVALLRKRSDPLAFLWLIEPFLAALQSDPVVATLIEDIGHLRGQIGRCGSVAIAVGPGPPQARMWWWVGVAAIRRLLGVGTKQRCGS